jgi:hypothetical protein
LGEAALHECEVIDAGSQCGFYFFIADVDAFDGSSVWELDNVCVVGVIDGDDVVPGGGEGVEGAAVEEAGGPQGGREENERKVLSLS